MAPVRLVCTSETRRSVDKLYQWILAVHIKDFGFYLKFVESH
jgi:hypothetical protein